MEIFILLFFTLFNALFSMSEMAVVSSKRARLQQLVENGNASAKVALQLTESPTRFLSTVQVAITLISILSGAFGEQAISSQLSGTISTAIPALSDLAPTLATLITVAITAYLSVVLGELVPKRLALRYPETIATLIARPMNILSMIATPIVSLLSLSSRTVLKLLGVKEDEQQSVSEFEVLAMIDEGTQQGVFDTQEQQFINAVFELDSQKVKEIMTPRNEIQWLNLNRPLEENLVVLIQNNYSTYPVAKGDLDHVAGMVKTKDILHSVLERVPIDLEALMTPIHFVPETLTISEALQSLKEANTHTALVLGEFGEVEGILRLHDIIEEFLGTVREADDHAEEEAIQRSDGSYLLDGTYPIDELTRFYPEFSLPESEAEKYHTLAGFVLARLQRVPTVGDTFSYQALRFEVIDMDSRRIDKVLVQFSTPSDSRP